MAGIDRRSLQQDLERFQREKEHIRAVIGQIGDVGATRRDRVVNIAFIVAVAFLFVLDVVRHLLDIPIPLPPMFFIGLGVLLVSIKIVWMIHQRTKVEHFQFWILSSIEFRLDHLARRIRQFDDQQGGATRSRRERRSPVRKEILRVEVERAARVCRTNRDASRVLGISEHTFVMLCRGYGIQLPDDREEFQMGR